MYFQGLDDTEKYMQHFIAETADPGCYDALRATYYLAATIMPAFRSMAGS